ncbi:hypothetical protein KCP78_04040 [Salmonella enterica subsp. enterica]|nr:hypothetical protein KCP78_04040 [Salmonella enterica subsp. enterica]
MLLFRTDNHCIYHSNNDAFCTVVFDGGGNGLADWVLRGDKSVSSSRHVALKGNAEPSRMTVIEELTCRNQEKYPAIGLCICAFYPFCGRATNGTGAALSISRRDC